MKFLMKCVCSIRKKNLLSVELVFYSLLVVLSIATGEFCAAVDSNIKPLNRAATGSRFQYSPPFPPSNSQTEASKLQETQCQFVLAKKAGSERRVSPDNSKRTLIVDPVVMKFLQKPPFVGRFAVAGDRAVILLADTNTADGFSVRDLTRNGQLTLQRILEEIDLKKMIRGLMERLLIGGVDSVDSIENLIQGELWMERLLAARNNHEWLEVVRIFDEELQGVWKDYPDVRLQAALALNKLESPGARQRALEIVHKVIGDAKRTGEFIQSEAYETLGRILEDEFEISKKQNMPHAPFGNSDLLDRAISAYRHGYAAEPRNYNPGINAMILLLSKGDLESERQAMVLGELVNNAIELAFVNVKSQGIYPDFKLLTAKLKLLVLLRQWDKIKDEQALESVLNQAIDPRSLKTSLDLFNRLRESWRNALAGIADSGEKTKSIDVSSEPSDRLGFDIVRISQIIKRLEKAIEHPMAASPLTENSLSYPANAEGFAAVDDFFGTKPIALFAELEQSQIRHDLTHLAELGEVDVKSIHKFLQQAKLGELAANGVLLDPYEEEANPYRTVMSSIAKKTGLTSWWSVYQEAGINLDPRNSRDFFEYCRTNKKQIYFIVPRNFKSNYSETVAHSSYQYIQDHFSDLKDLVTFVFGFEHTFPRDFQERLLRNLSSSRSKQAFSIPTSSRNPRQVLTSAHRQGIYIQQIVEIFLNRFQNWLVDLGSNVRFFSIKSLFHESQYREVYDQVLQHLSYHQILRQTHSQWMPNGDENYHPIILDLGAGTGLVAREMIKSDYHRQVELFDSSTTMLSVAMERNAKARSVKRIPGNRFHLSDVTHLVRADGNLVPDGSVDGVTMNNVIYLLPMEAVRRTFQEIQRVLKVDGVFSLSTMREASPEIHQAFLASVTAEVGELEKNHRVGVGASKILDSANKALLKRDPTKFTASQLQQLGAEFDLKVIFADENSFYGGAGVFMVFKKVSSSLNN